MRAWRCAGRPVSGHRTVQAKAMSAGATVSLLLLDIGGVLLTNGWSTASRLEAARRFGIDYEEMNGRHHMIFDSYERGRVSLDTYLDRVVFFCERPFTRDEFKSFMFAQSQPMPETLDLFRGAAKRNPVRVAALSNEGRELTTYRIAKFKLSDFVEFFVCSCFVNCRKPDDEIYRMALDMAQASPEHTLYFDDRSMFVEAARGLGIRSFHHKNLEGTRSALLEAGLSV